MIKSADHQPSISDRKLPPVTVAILNYNRADYILDAIRAFQSVDYPGDRLEILVIDNGSTDGSARRIEAEFGDDVVVNRLPFNIGAVARNRAILSNRSPYIFMFDEDVRPRNPSLIRTAVEFMESNPYFGALCFSCFNPAINGTEYGHPGNVYARKHGDVYEGMYVIGNGMCFRSEAIQKTNGYDERLFWGGEEFDLALEFMRCGVPIAYRHDLQIVHYHAPQAHPSARASELDMRNNIWIAAGRFPLTLVIPYELALISRRLVMSALKHDKTRLYGYLRGLRSGFGGFVTSVRRRRPVTWRQLLGHRRWVVGLVYAPRSHTPKSRRATGAAVRGV